MAPRRETLVDAGAAGALAVFAGVLRAGEVGQSSLWLDDAWIALAHKADGLNEFLLTALTAPGFAALLKGWLAVVGFSATKAQVLPFLIGTAGPPLVYLVLTRRGVGRLGAAIGGFLLAVSTLHIAYSVRVKQYTLDAVMVIAVLAIAWWVLEHRDDVRRWWILAGVSVAAMLLSSAAIVVVVPVLTVTAVALLQARGWRALRVAIPPIALVAVFFAAWWTAVLRPAASNPKLHDFFANHYITLGEGPGTAYRETVRAIRPVVEGAIALPRWVAVCLVLVAAAVALWRRPAVGSLLVAPLGTAVVLAALDLVPLGTGRTDIYLFPALAMLVAVAFDELGRVFMPAAVFGALLLSGLWFVERDSPRRYPREDIAPLVQQVEAEASPSDAIFIYPFSQFAYGLYTTSPIRIVETPNYSTGFELRISRNKVFIPPAHWRDASLYAPMIDRIATSAPTVWFLATHARKDVGKIEALLQARGYSRDFVRRRPGAHLSRWSKEG